MSEQEHAVQNIEAFARRALDAPSWCHLLVYEGSADVRAVFDDLGPVTRRVHGSKMRTNDLVDDEFAAVWQFSDYDGPSRGAFFRDSIHDLYLTWPTAVGFVVVVSDADQLLLDEPEPAVPWTPLRALVSLFDEAAENYAEPMPGASDDPTARPALSFDVVLVTDAEHRDEVVRRWRAAGAPLGD